MKVNSIFEYKKYSGSENMRLDLILLEEAKKDNKEDEIYLRFYGWEPRCISFGRNQKKFLPKIKIDTVTRPTGGRALLHDNEITYAVSGKILKGESVLETYKRVSKGIINGFQTLGINLNFGGEKSGLNNYCMNTSTGADLCYKGKKLIGSAEYRKEGFFLQHGSIPFKIDYELFEEIFEEPIQRNKIITLTEINPNINELEIISAITLGFMGIQSQLNLKT